MTSRLSLRFRLMLLVVATLLPLGALSVWSAISGSRVALAQAQDQLTLTASLVASQQDRQADAAEHLLAAISALPGLLRLDRDRCDAYMADLRRRYPIYGNIGVQDLQGTPSAMPPAAKAISMPSTGPTSSMRCACAASSWASW